MILALSRKRQSLQVDFALYLTKVHMNTEINPICMDKSHCLLSDRKKRIAYRTLSETMIQNLDVGDKRVSDLHLSL